ncbi:MAG: tripartite tricarboxylate transporter substrate binding protein [Burkholderiales bacterium]
MLARMLCRAGVLGLLLGAGGAGAAAPATPDYPNKPVRVVVVYPAGGGIDILVRAIGQKLTDVWGPPLIVDNRPGAGTTIGAAIVAKSAPDGYTLLATDVSFAITPTLYPKLPYDPVKELTPIILLNLVTDVLVIHPSLPATTVKELITYAKANPGKVLYASAGNGTLNHLAPEMLKSMAGIDLVHVPYKGAVAALADVISGREQLYIGALASTVPHIKAGRIRALAITGKKRSNVLPDLPTVAESGLPDYDVSAWYGLLAPAGTPKPIIDKINREVKATLGTPDILQRLAADGSEPVGGSPDEFREFIRTEIAKWGKAVRAAGAKVD